METNTDRKLYRPGERPGPGTYRESGPMGGKISGARTAVIREDGKLPATRLRNRTWVKVDGSSPDAQDQEKSLLQSICSP